MRIGLIAAIGPDRELGKDNKLLYHIPEDLKRFKKITEGHAVIMGRKTYESIGKPLPGRLNIIVTKNRAWTPLGWKNCKVFYSLREAIKYVQYSTFKKNEVFVIGGGEIYRQTIEYADKLYLTIVNKKVKADTFFPDYSDFKKVVFEEKHESKEYKYKFVELERGLF